MRGHLKRMEDKKLVKRIMDLNNIGELKDDHTIDEELK